MGPVVIQTARLNLRGWTSDDAPALVQVLSHPDVTRFINNGTPADLDAAVSFIERYSRIQEERGWGRWAVALRTEPAVVGGFCGVGCTFAPQIELGWTLRRDLWGQGLATEAAGAALDYCFSVVGFDRVISAVDPENHRSEAVARRIGMRPDGTVDHEGTPLTRFVADNPLERPPRSPRFVRTCDGELPGGSFGPAADGG